jgi:hypothetical protein
MHPGWKWLHSSMNSHAQISMSEYECADFEFEGMFWEEIVMIKELDQCLLEQGQTQGSTLQQRTKKTLNTDHFGNTCEADEGSLEVEAGVVTELKCLQT